MTIFLTPVLLSSIVFILIAISSKLTEIRDKISKKDIEKEWYEK